MFIKFSQIKNGEPFTGNRGAVYKDFGSHLQLQGAVYKIWGAVYNNRGAVYNCDAVIILPTNEK
jgi:hypothetical protein